MSNFFSEQQILLSNRHIFRIRKKFSERTKSGEGSCHYPVSPQHWVRYPFKYPTALHSNFTRFRDIRFCAPARHFSLLHSSLPQISPCFPGRLGVGGWPLGTKSEVCAVELICNDFTIQMRYCNRPTFCSLFKYIRQFTVSGDDYKIN